MEKNRSPFAPPINIYLADCKSGHVLAFGSPGSFDAVSFIGKRPAAHPMGTDVQLAVQTLEWMLWQLDQQSRAQQKMVQVVKVIDFAGLGTHKIPIAVPEMRALIQKYAPLIMKCYCEHDILYCLVNTPMIFRVLWAFMSRIMYQRQRNRVLMFKSAASADCQEVLAQLLPPSALPSSIGGQMDVVPLVIPPASQDTMAVNAFLARTGAPVSLAGARPDGAPSQPAPALDVAPAQPAADGPADVARAPSVQQVSAQVSSQTVAAASPQEVDAPFSDPNPALAAGAAARKPSEADPNPALAVSNPKLQMVEVDSPPVKGSCCFCSI